MPENETPGAPSLEIPSIPVKPASEFLDRATLELQISLRMRKEYENLLQIWKNDAFAELEKKQDEVIALGLKTYFDKWKEEQKPPEPEDIQKLLDQEYETFTIPIDYVKFENEEEVNAKMTFTVRELPQSIEKKFYRQFKEKLKGKASLLEAFTQSGIDKPFEEKVDSFMSLFDESFDLLADAVLLVLNPFGRRKEITKEWVQNNIGSDRQWRIVEAQLKVNRLRDFFSKVSASGQNVMMTTRPNFQSLQQLVQ
jgi:hypothetical protein